MSLLQMEACLIAVQAVNNTILYLISYLCCKNTITALEYPNNLMRNNWVFNIKQFLLKLFQVLNWSSTYRCLYERRFLFSIYHQQRWTFIALSIRPIMLRELILHTRFSYNLNIFFLLFHFLFHRTNQSHWISFICRHS